MSEAILTYRRLKAAGACEDQLALFKAEFGSKVVVTVEAALAVAGKFNWPWGCCLLDDEGQTAYDAAIAPAWAEAFIASEARRAAK